jgi:2-keto-4-pentenoate hydratase
VTDVDPRLAAALAVQLRHWRTTLESGAERVGWKVGAGDRERIGSGPVIGHLTSATLLEPGAAFRADGVVALHADAEVALELGRVVDPDGDRNSAWAAIARFGAALELVDLAAPPDDPESIVATNVFHRAVAFGPLEPSPPAAGESGRLVVNGGERASAPVSVDLADVVRSVAMLLGAMGQRLQAGDRLITGSVVQVAIERGDEVIADLGALGRAAVAIAP